MGKRQQIRVKQHIPLTRRLTTSTSPLAAALHNRAGASGPANSVLRFLLITYIICQYGKGKEEIWKKATSYTCEQQCTEPYISVMFLKSMTVILPSKYWLLARTFAVALSTMIRSWKKVHQGKSRYRKKKKREEGGGETVCLRILPLPRFTPLQP